ncbi:enkurin domain-containing protein 1 isoform X1 [Coregonus clupeaformis]|uniref:enkurin domain-containing protein 1 isoform X1 n=1 Tax=Coregonus clupeaformis TaxID=59861 RepID=UPI001BDFE282|nr:enkurin domain-containing protein 1 isoform X1 [Coregonus clupeaformis]XP_041741056.1 enkurin domain-containing protein 1 isoform X1 [Coregonus clupeaformis]
MCEGPSMISGPIPPDPSLFPEYYKRPASARGRLEGNAHGTPALLSGPLAPDPVLYPGCYSSRAPRHPRIGPNATHILEKGQRGVMGALLRLEGVSLSPNPTKHKQLVRDYGKENVRRLREIQRRCREQEAQREHSRPVPVKALWSSPKYQDIPSRVMAQLQETSPPMKPECQNFLKAHSICGSAGPPRPKRALSPSTRTSRAPSPSPSPRSASQNHTGNQSLQLQVQGRMVDFVSHNAQAAGKTVLRRSQSLTNLRNSQPLPSAVKGQVPQYLEERKEQWRREEEEKRRNIPDPSIPAGHTLMPERERQETLESLKETHRSLVSELLSLPVRADSLGVRSRRAQLDRRLSEVEEAIKIFSRDKVYVKTDS